MVLEKHPNAFYITNDIQLGDGSLVLIAGPCVIESESLVLSVAEQLKTLAGALGLPLIFKSSFDKANRTGVYSFRGVGLEKGLNILQKVKETFDVPLLTDIHESNQAAAAADVVDILQIPAFLCRQTDLILACAQTGQCVNIKKGQYMAPDDMQHAIAKAQSTGNNRLALTERGTAFGYHNLVVDMRSLAVMRDYAPVLFDVTHSVQQPGGRGGSSGGQREFTLPLARAAVATGVDGLFIETHPDPDNALSDGPNMIPLDRLGAFLEQVITLHNT